LISALGAAIRERNWERATITTYDLIEAASHLSGFSGDTLSAPEIDKINSIKALTSDIAVALASAGEVSLDDTKREWAVEGCVQALISLKTIQGSLENSEAATPRSTVSQ
jgi:hypothetical protein